MASQWNEELLSQFTPVAVVRDGRTVRTDDGRLVLMRATGGEFVPLNDHQIEMQELDLYMRNDLVTKPSEVVNNSSAQHANHSTDHSGFDSTSLSLVSSDASLLMHPDQEDLQANHFVTSPSRQLPELVPQCLQSLGSALDDAVTEEFQPQHTPQEAQHHASLLQVNENQQHPHLQQHLDHQSLEQRQQSQSSADLLLTQTMEFDSSDSHPLTEQSLCADHAPSPHFAHHHQQQHVSVATTTITQQPSQSQLPGQDVHPMSSFHLQDNILEENVRPEECVTTLSSPNTTLSFLTSNPPLQVMGTVDVSRPESTPVNVPSNTGVTNCVEISPNPCGKSKKRKLADKSNGDMVWLNCKSLEARQRDRQATQILIDIVSLPKWQEKLNSTTTKKKAVWREIGEEFISKGYFLANPGNKCFQKWRNLERSFRDYETSKKIPSAVPKCLPDFYEELQPILKEKLSLDTLFDGKGEQTGTVNKVLMEKYVDFNSGPHIKEKTTEPSGIPTSSQSNHLNSSMQNNYSNGSDNTELLRRSDDAPSEKKSTQRSGRIASNMKHNPGSTADCCELMTSVVEGLKSQQKDLAQMNFALHSIKELLEEQKKEREVTKAESRSRFLELKSLIERNQKEKMAFMYEFMKTVKSDQNRHSREKPL